MTKLTNQAKENEKMIAHQCATCAFFFADGLECRRFPPVIHEFTVVGPTDWCGEYKEAQTKPSLFTTATTSLILASLPAASEVKLRKHKTTLEEALRSAPSKPDAERIMATLHEVERYLALACIQRDAEVEAARVRRDAEAAKFAEQEASRPTLETANQSLEQAINVCKEAKKNGLTWPREAAEFVNRGPISDDEWKNIASYWDEAWDRILLGE